MEEIVLSWLDEPTMERTEMIDLCERAFYTCFPQQASTSTHSTRHAEPDRDRSPGSQEPSSRLPAG